MEKKKLKPLVVYVKQSYSLLGPGMKSSSGSCQSLSTVIDFNNNNVIQDENSRPPPLSACPISHELLIIITLKQALLNNNDFPIEIKLVNPNKSLPEELICKQIFQLPAIIDPNNDYDNNESELVDYLQKNYPTPELSTPEVNNEIVWEISSVIHNVNVKFYNFIRKFYSNDNYSDTKPLINALGVLDQILSKFETQWEADKHYPSTLGCHLMPRLHHIRVTLEYLTEKTIPDHYRYVWNYLEQTYLFEPFRRWCPSDQEILIHWMIKSNFRSIDPRSYRRQMMRLIRLSPTYSFDKTKL